MQNTNARWSIRAEYSTEIANPKHPFIFAIDYCRLWLVTVRTVKTSTNRNEQYTSFLRLWAQILPAFGSDRKGRYACYIRELHPRQHMMISTVLEKKICVTGLWPGTQTSAFVNRIDEKTESQLTAVLGPTLGAICNQFSGISMSRWCVFSMRPTWKKRPRCTRLTAASCGIIIMGGVLQVPSSHSLWLQLR